MKSAVCLFSALLAAIAIAYPAAADDPIDLSPSVIAGEDSLGEVMVDESVDIYTDNETTMQRFVGDRYYAGGRGGALGSFVVKDVLPPDCGNTSLHLDPELPNGFFVAYSQPALFLPLEPAPTLYDAVVAAVEPAIRAKGGSGKVQPYALWRLQPSDRALVFATFRTPNYRDESWGNPDGFDAIALLSQTGDTLTVLDTIVWRADPLGLSMQIDAMAAAINPSSGRIELFLRYQSFEYNEYVGYDVTDGTFVKRTYSECSM